MKHVQRHEAGCFYEYLNWYTGGFQGAFIAREGYYSAQPENARKFLTQAEWDYWYGGKPAATDIINPFGKLMEKAGANARRRFVLGSARQYRRVERGDGRGSLSDTQVERIPHVLKWSRRNAARCLHSDRQQWLADLDHLAAIQAQLRPEPAPWCEKAEAFGFDFALSMIKLHGFGGPSGFWDYNLESFTLMAGLAAVTSRIQLFATCAVLTMPPPIAARMAVTID